MLTWREIAVGEPYTATFATLDTIGPTIATLRIAGGIPPLASKTIPVEVILATNEVGASVRYTQDFRPISSNPTNSFRADVTLPATGSTTVRAIATDQFGNDGAVVELVIAVIGDLPPTVRFLRVTPTNGPVPSATFMAVDVIASDDSGIVQVKATVSGLDTGSVLSTNSAVLRVQGIIPETAGPNQQIQIVAEAIDNSGQSSGQKVFSLSISDGTRPALTVSSPSALSSIESGSVVPIKLLLQDNFGVASVKMSISGAFTSVVTSAVSPAITNGLFQLSLNVPSGAPTNGESVQIQFEAIDAAGNSSIAATLPLRMADRTPPSIVSTTPTDQSTGVDTAQIIEVLFSEPLNTNTISDQSFALFATLNTNRLAATVKLDVDQKTVLIEPASALIANASYRLVIDRSVSDLSGNTLLSGVTNEFRTAEFRLVRPPQGAKIIEGQFLILEASSSTLTFEKVRFSANDAVIGVVATAPTTNGFLVPALSALASNQITFKAVALSGADVKIAEASAKVTVFSGTADSDGDGVSNADEIARGTDPFHPNAAPVIQFTNHIEIVQGVQTNFSLSATDADGNLRRLQVLESVEDENVRLFDELQFSETGNGNFAVSTNAAGLTATITLRHAFTNAVEFVVRATDSDGLTATQTVTVVTLQDLDGDGIPDRDDADIDGDGLSNVQELAIGTNVRNPDTDGDGISDGVEVSGSNGFVTDPLLPDTDGDGVSDGFEVALGTDRQRLATTRA